VQPAKKQRAIAERALPQGNRVTLGGVKQSGMFWSESGAERIQALRCLHSSRRLEEFWKYRLNNTRCPQRRLGAVNVNEEFCLIPSYASLTAGRDASPSVRSGYCGIGRLGEANLPYLYPAVTEAPHR
jgi:hypothetical protein